MSLAPLRISGPNNRLSGDIDEFAPFRLLDPRKADLQHQQDLAASENDDAPHSPAKRRRLMSPLDAVKEEEPGILREFRSVKVPDCRFVFLLAPACRLSADLSPHTATRPWQPTSPTSTRPKSTSSRLQLSFSPRRKNPAARRSPTFPNGPTRKRRVARIPPSHMPCTVSQTATWNRLSNGARKVGSCRTSRSRRYVINATSLGF